jgi:hypothetical protein
MKSSTRVRPIRLRHQHHQVHIIRAHDHDRRREELVGEGDHRPQRRPVLMVDVGEMVGAADGGALVDADRSAIGDAVGEEAGDGRRVEALDVIAFQEGVHDQLPVGRHVVDAAAVEVVAGEAEGVEFGGEGVGVGEIRAFVAREPDQPARLAAGQRRGRARPCRGRGRCPAAAGRRARRRARRTRRDRGRRGAARRAARRLRPAACRGGGRRSRRRAPCPFCRG